MNGQPTRLPRAALVATVLALAAGCGSKTAVTGKVTYRGAPVTGGSVTLVASDGTAYAGTIQADGTYSIPDVPTGSVQIGVAGPGRGGASSRAGAGGRGDAGAIGRGKAPDRPTQEAKAPAGPSIPDTYLDPRTSGLTGTVKAGERLNIDLK
ncbi:MAG TPA: carboxypeptidase-like regulatory domain-containing protein [Gemmataceae bacterium]|nr:carboxypeptidase-like regulatory domain-containing protein [Gemmataceae bacterium]